MTVERLMNQPLQLQRQSASAVNGYGDKSLSALSAPVTVYGYLFQLATDEALVDRDVVRSDWHCHLPVGTQIGALDYITFQGSTYQVDGEPHQVYNPRLKRVSHIECSLRVTK